MKYLTIILIIVGLAIVLTFLFLVEPDKHQSEKIALTINGREVSEDSIIAEHKKFGYHTQEPHNRYDSIITKQLLIEEAKKQAIDKEESFRKALKDYYESSLVKILLERKEKQIEVNVSEAEIDRFLSFTGKIVSFTRLDTIPANDQDAKDLNGISTKAIFDDLADSVKLVLYSLNPGGFGIGFDTGHEKNAIRLDSIQSTASTAIQPLDRNYIGDLLEQYQREQKMNIWLSSLIEEANIKIYLE